MEQQVNDFSEHNWKYAHSESKYVEVQHTKLNSLHPKPSELILNKLKVVKHWKADPLFVAKNSDDLG